MAYASYTRTRNSGRKGAGALRIGQMVAVKIVAATWQNEHGKWWAAYWGDGELSNDAIADHGVKLDRTLAERLFPQIVAAGCEWWD